MIGRGVGRGEELDAVFGGVGRGVSLLLVESAFVAVVCRR